jgi:GNAT superfamily N-acetyltransferase
MAPFFSVRNATVADADLCARHRAGMFRDMGELPAHLVEPLIAASRRYFEEAIPAGEYLAWLASPADRPDEIVAGAGLQLRRVLPRPQRNGPELLLGVQALVLNVYTERDWRRRGLAELLMGRLLEWCEANGVANVVLHASRDGRALYEKLGFEATNEMRWRGKGS